MRGLDPRIHDFVVWGRKEVDDRAKPGQGGLFRSIVKAGGYWSVYRRARKILKEILAAPDHSAYTDLALTPPDANEFDQLDLYQHTHGGAGALAHMRRDEAVRAKVG